jgi:hypothetical protein
VEDPLAREARGVSDPYLAERATVLADQYMDGERPRLIQWSKRMRSRLGTCSYTSGLRTIRITDRLTYVPEWVLDITIVHELAHLIEQNHGPAFWTLANRHPRIEEEKAFWETYEYPPEYWLEVARDNVRTLERWIERANAWRQWDEAGREFRAFPKLQQRYGNKITWREGYDPLRELAELQAEVRRLGAEIE